MIVVVVIVEVELDTWPNMVRQLARAVVAELGHDRAELLGLTAVELDRVELDRERTAEQLGLTEVELAAEQDAISRGGACAVEIRDWGLMLIQLAVEREWTVRP